MRRPRRLAAAAVGERLGRRRRPGRVAGLVAGEQVEQRGGLGDGAREHAVDRPAAMRRASGAGETRWRCALRPTSPQQAAGIRSEPPPSLPWAIGTMPAATAAAAPPEEPPGVRSGPTGCGPGRSAAARSPGRIPYSGSFVVPTITKPASRSRAHDGMVVGGDVVAHQVAAHGQPQPGHGAVVLDRDRHAGERARVAGPIASAAASAPSWSTWTKAPSSGSSASIRAQRALTSSRAESSPARTSAASSPTGANMSSDTRRAYRAGHAAAEAPRR